MLVLLCAHPAPAQQLARDALLAEARSYDNAYVRLDRARRDRAIELYELAVALDPYHPRNAEILLRVGMMWVAAFDASRGEIQEPTKALWAFERADALRARRGNDDIYVTDLQIWVFLGEGYQRHQRHADAVRAYKRFFEVDPDKLVFPPWVIAQHAHEPEFLKQLEATQRASLDTTVRDVFVEHVMMHANTPPEHMPGEVRIALREVRDLGVGFLDDIDLTDRPEPVRRHESTPASAEPTQPSAAEPGATWAAGVSVPNPPPRVEPYRPLARWAAYAIALLGATVLVGAVWRARFFRGSS